MKIQQAKKFINEDIWRIRLEDEPRQRRAWLLPLRIAVMSVKEFVQDQCGLRASALTFFTLMSIVPVLALAFGIAKGFGLDDRLEETVRNAVTGQFVQIEQQAEEKVAADQPTPQQAQSTDNVTTGTAGQDAPPGGQEAQEAGDGTEAEISTLGQVEVLDRAMDFASNLLEQTKGGVIAGIGVVLLLWAVIRMLGNIEMAFNNIWMIEQPRSLIRRFSDYLSVMVVAPILFIMASSTAGLLAAAVRGAVEKVAWLSFLTGPVQFLFYFIPIFLMAGLFAFLYLFMPNGRVKITSALIGGVVAAILYFILQWALIQFQVGVSKTNAIYGSFAALPLFLIWVQVSWAIVLFGAEVAFAHQFHELSLFATEAEQMSPRSMKLMALMVTKVVVDRFEKGEPPLDARQIADNTGIPLQIMDRVLNQLLKAGIISEVIRQEDQAKAYQPAEDIENIRIHHVIDKIERTGLETFPIREGEYNKVLQKTLKDFDTMLDDSEKNRKLREI